jgi:hypothetical protein
MTARTPQESEEGRREIRRCRGDTGGEGEGKMGTETGVVIGESYSSTLAITPSFEHVDQCMHK